ncbi:WecB/TagA/CpsF family glycosyltransferase [Mycolicibacterium holsaticum]|uniref:WecB/TagA/CpsF family glycosyltransferase n=1 Tax=Mycolicibacterium holsaticum TaxID=152142 RepID=UPI00197B533B|nr:WecB/TagA/CpsF family glycosyltransferase [Mycolicibacterium holsaticum]
MRDADIVHADGMSAVFASRLTSTPLPERICTTDFFVDAAEVAALHKLKFFFLGSNEEQNAAAVAAARRIHPELEIAGRHHGYFGEDEDEAICRLIRQSGADVLWVALGKPKQEFWCVRNRKRLAGIGWVKTCGGLFSYLAGDAPRAPRWVRVAGLEWFYRLMDDPKRLAWRYFTTNPYALYRLLRYTDRRAKSRSSP